MRILLAATSTALISLHGTLHAAPLRACEHVWSLVDVAVGPLLTGPAQSQQPVVAQLRGQFRACVVAHNICAVVYDSRHRKEAVVAGDVTGDLPPRDASGQPASPAILLVRSIPRVRNDSNQYCLVARQSGPADTPRQWAVYGWVIAPNASEALPLQEQLLEVTAISEPISLRGLAAALWFFAQRMSGQPPPLALLHTGKPSPVATVLRPPVTP